MNARKEAHLKERHDAAVANWEHQNHQDDMQGNEMRKAAAHAHVATHHALEMDHEAGHKMAIQAHKKVIDLHKEAIQSCHDEPDGDEHEDE